MQIVRRNGQAFAVVRFEARPEGLLGQLVQLFEINDALGAGIALELGIPCRRAIPTGQPSVMREASAAICDCQVHVAT